MKKIPTIFKFSSLAFGLSVWLYGCGGHSEEQKPDGSLRVTNGGFGDHVKIVVLEDGTRCAVLIGLKKGGISCDWSQE